jgi:hypothetical protein
MYLYNKQLLVGDHLLLRDFGTYGIFIKVSVLITVVTVMVLTNLGPDVFYLHAD